MRRVIVIGASSGIGLEMAEYYASAGCCVGIAARREDKLREMQERHSGNVVYMGMDVTDASASGKFNVLVEKLGGVDLVIYCSGAGRHIEELELEVEMDTVRVNINGFLHIVIPACNYFSSRKDASEYVPQLVAISSVASIKGLGSSPSYSATKRFQTTYFESLAQWAHNHCVKIDFTAILPGFIATGFIHRKYPMTMTTEYAVKRIVRAIEKRKKIQVIDWRWKMVVILLHLIPTALWRKIRLG